MASGSGVPESGAGGFLDAIERIGNKVPHPAVIFLILLAAVVVLSHVLYLLGTSVTYQTFDLETDLLVSNTVAVNSLLTADGIRFLFTSMIRNFMGFGPVGVILVAMIGVGLAEQAGLVTALIKKIVSVAPAWSLTYIIVGRRRAVEHCRGRRLPGPDPAGCGRLPHRRPPPDRRHRRRLRRRGRGVPGQRDHRAGRRHPDRDHQRRHPSARPQHLDRPRSEPLLLDRVQPGPHRRRRAGHRARGRAAPRPLSRPAARQRGLPVSATPRPRACAGRFGASSRSWRSSPLSRCRKARPCAIR